MQALVSEERLFHCSVFRAQEARGPNRSLKGDEGRRSFREGSRRDDGGVSQAVSQRERKGSFLCLLSFSKESKRL